MRNRALRSVAIALGIALLATVQGSAVTHSQTPAGVFVSPPSFGAGGQASVVFGGGTLEQLESAAINAGAGGVWAQDSTGAFQLLVLGGPSFVRETFSARFPAGFGLVAVTLTQTESATPVATPAPDQTPGQTPSPSPSPSAGDGLTRAGAAAIGTPISTSDGWTVSVVSVTPDATLEVLNENMFNDVPELERQFFIARVRAAYNGATSERFGGDFRLRVVGAGAVSYSAFEDSCGVIPDRVSDAEVFAGGTIEGNVCWSVETSDVASLVMYDDSFLSFGSSDRRWWLLH